MKLRTRVRRIGITGSARAGKTVFLLSLIDHLKWGDLKLGADTTGHFQRRPCRPGPVAKLLAKMPGAGKWFDDDRREFEYDALRKHLAEEKEWPGKTTASFFFRCRFQRRVGGGKWKNLWRLVDRVSDDEIEFFDFPGERVADVAMIDQNFDEWSDAVIRGLVEDPRKAAAAETFIRLNNTETPQADAMVTAWKLALGRLILDCHSLITPSTYLVDVDGKTARERVREMRIAQGVANANARESAEELAEAGCAGLPGHEFAPMSATARKSSPDLARHFEEYYESYQRRVVRPFAAHLLSCHALIYLVDLADVLGSGVQKLNDTQEMIAKLIECIERGQGLFISILRGAVNLGRAILGGKWGFIDRIAFVASKADKIHTQDRDKLKPLLDDLAVKLAGGLGPSEVDCFGCSAVNSTTPVPGDGRILVGRPIRVIKDGKTVCLPADAEDECQVRVPELPRHWPDRWRVEDFQFTDFHPKIPAIHRKPPEQVGLDEILKFALDV